MVYKKTAGDICLNIFIFLFVGFLVVLILYPLIYVDVYKRQIACWSAARGRKSRWNDCG